MCILLLFSTRGQLEFIDLRPVRPVESGQKSYFRRSTRAKDIDAVSFIERV